MSNPDLSITADTETRSTATNVQAQVDSETSDPVESTVDIEAVAFASPATQSINETQGPSANVRIKHRPFTHSLGGERFGAVETWVLLDADGNTQEENATGAEHIEKSQLIPTLKAKSANVLRKLLHTKSKVEDSSTIKCVQIENLSDTEEETNSHTYHLEDSPQACTEITPKNTEKYIPTFSRSKVQEKARNMLKNDMLELRTNMLHSENVIKQSVAKYITDKRLEKEILQAVESYTCFRVEGEQRINTLAHKLIEEQVDFLKNLRLSSQETINDLQNRNQTLEHENLLLLKKIEKLQARTMKHCADNATQTLLSGDDTRILGNTNDMLHHKICYSRSQMENMKAHLKVAQQKEECLETEVGSLRMEMENHKLINAQLEADHQIECSMLKSALQMKTDILKQSLDAANVVIDDIDLLKTQLQVMGINILFNWNNVQTGSNSLCDLFNMSRFCINELGQTLMDVQKDCNVAKNETFKMKEEKDKLQQFLDLTVNEKKIMKERMDETCKEIEQLSQNNATLQEELVSNMPILIAQQQEIAKMHENSAVEKHKDELDDTIDKVIHEAFTSTARAASDAHIQKLMDENKQLFEKLKIAELNAKKFQEKSKANNKAKKNQESVVHELNRENKSFRKEIITSSKSQNCHAEQVIKLEKELYKVSAEKACLADELQSFQSEQKELIQSRNEYYTHLQTTQHDIAILGEEHAALKVKYDMAVRLGYDPYSKEGVHSMENKIQVMQAELVETHGIAEQLEYVAIENNKHIEKWKKSCGDKEVLITNIHKEMAEIKITNQKEIMQLQHKIELLETNLASIKKESQRAKDKYMTAQHEIERLNDTVNRSNEVIASYKYLESEFQSVQAHGAHQREENATLQGRLNDYNKLLNHRDKLIECHKELLSETENLHNHLNSRDKRIDSLITDNTNKAVKIAEIEEKLKHTESILNQATGTAKSTLTGVEGLKLELNHAAVKLEQYEKHVSNVDRDIEKHVINMERNLEKAQEDKTKLAKEVCYLKDSIEGMQISLEQALKQISIMKKLEKELRKALKDERMQTNVMKEVIRAQEIELGKAETLREASNEASMQHAKLKNEYQHQQKIMAKNNENTKDLLENNSKNVNDLTREIVKLSEEKEKYKMDLNVMSMKMSAMEEEKCHLQTQLDKTHTQVQEELVYEQRKCTKLASKINDLEKEQQKTEQTCQSLQKENADVLLELEKTNMQLQESTHMVDKYCAQIEEEKNQSQIFLSESNSQHTDQMKRLIKEIKLMGINKQQLEQAMIEGTRCKEMLQAEHRELTGKLLRAIQLSIEEKTARQIVESQCRQFETIIADLKSAQQESVATANELREHVNTLMKQLELLNSEKKTLENDLQLSKNQQAELQQSNKILYEKIKNLQEKFDAAQGMGDQLASQVSALNVSQTQARIAEERANRMADELKEARERLLNLRQSEGILQKDIVYLQTEIRNLRLQVCSLEGIKEKEKKLSLRALDNLETIPMTIAHAQLLQQTTKAILPD